MCEVFNTNEAKCRRSSQHNTTDVHRHMDRQDSQADSRKPPKSFILQGYKYTDLTLSQTTNFRLFQTGRGCRRHFKFDENGRKFSQWVENSLGKGEIAPCEQFLLFPHCFPMTCTTDT